MPDLSNIEFDLPKNQSNVIKVIGVGGGGSNAINHMFQQGIDGVDFVICNTDAQALQNSPVPNKIQLGVHLTEGLGAGANPEVGQQSAIESIEDLEKMLDTNTRMLFITAGMGGGTGTGAAPVIAKLAKERDILTVGIVTIPFSFEGNSRAAQAMEGVERLRKNVDSLIVINNNKLRDVYGNLGFKAGFSKADEVLATAARGIAEVITHHYTQNIDLKDAKTVLSDSGTAIMGSANATGEERAKTAIVSALDSPLLNDNKIKGAKNVLLLIVSGSDEITIDEIGEINDYIQAEAGHNANIIMGVGEDETLGESISVTIIATGFNSEQQAEIVNTEPKKIIHSLESDQKIEQQLTGSSREMISNEPIEQSVTETPVANKEEVKAIEESEKIVFTLEEPATSFEIIEAKKETANDFIATTQAIKSIPVEFENVSASVNPNFQYTTVAIKNINVVDAQIIKATTETEFQPDLFNQLSKEVLNVEVNEPLNVSEEVKNQPESIVRFTLEEFEEIENQFVQSKAEETIVDEVEVDEELDIKFKVKEETVEQSKAFNGAIDPTEMSIVEALKLRTEERKRTLKEFNHKFASQSRIDELEREPAYKRNNVILREGNIENTTSRLSVELDDENQVYLKSNNSFLHDNVD
jgi:cell division protein FtsZ